MTKYRNVIFLQGSEAVPFIELLNEKGSKYAMEELFNYDYGEGEFEEREPWGSLDKLHFWRDSSGSEWILSVNEDLDYIALTEKITS